MSSLQCPKLQKKPRNVNNRETTDREREGYLRWRQEEEQSSSISCDREQRKRETINTQIKKPKFKKEKRKKKLENPPKTPNKKWRTSIVRERNILQKFS